MAEADESDGAFLVYRPHAAVVTNVEADHLDVWGTEEAYRAAFDEFADTVDPDGLPGVLRRRPGRAATWPTRARDAGPRVVTVGEARPTPTSAPTDLAFEGTTSAFTVVRRDGELGDGAAADPRPPLRPRRPGRAGAGLRLGHDFEDLRAGWGLRRLGSADGAKGEAGGVRVYDSYAHHPVEIAADLQAARAVAGEGRLVVAFQPHLVSRTRIFGAEMGEALGAADEVVVLDVYLAREEPDPAVTGALVADAVPLPADRVASGRRPRRVPAALARGPAPVTWCSPWARGASPSVGPGVLACWRSAA